MPVVGVKLPLQNWMPALKDETITFAMPIPGDCVSMCSINFPSEYENLLYFGVKNRPLPSRRFNGTVTSVQMGGQTTHTKTKIEATEVRRAVVAIRRACVV